MNDMRYAMRSVCAAAALLLAACEAGVETEVISEGATVCPKLRFSVSEMTMSAETRALSPISPDMEKYVKTLAIFEFDNEGLHEKRATSYHFIDFVGGYVDGVKTMEKTDYGVVEASLDGLAFEARSDGTICLVANVTEAQVAEFYDKYREPGQSYGRMTFDRFQTWSLPFTYKTAPSGSAYDETVSGHVEDMYMFGYYQGAVDPATVKNIAVDLGRLASRLDITFINETGDPIKKRLGYHLDNVCIEALFFPMKVGKSPVRDRSLARTVICSGENEQIDGGDNIWETFGTGEDGIHTRYFYVAAHSAQGKYDATQLHIFYGRPVVDDKEMVNEDNTVVIPLCNVHGAAADEVPNGYSLSRNTRYHFVIRLKKKDSAPSGMGTRSTVFEERPGEFTVYL